MLTGMWGIVWLVLPSHVIMLADWFVKQGCHESLTILNLQTLSDNYFSTCLEPMWDCIVCLSINFGLGNIVM